eukprot:TRINITY_DN13921_c0_g1_i1.p1 TRINITY_DN13921_c0_g1~~TRINITY_DN13921_c0_g1_i1.p1  ORF type:complete len:303 (+),score=53.69 TRINITY_DN13921_c0_g1_i1:90-911(+)
MAYEDSLWQNMGSCIEMSSTNLTLAYELQQEKLKNFCLKQWYQRRVREALKPFSESSTCNMAYEDSLWQNMGSCIEMSSTNLTLAYELQQEKLKNFCLPSKKLHSSDFTQSSKLYSTTQTSTQRTGTNFSLYRTTEDSQTSSLYMSPYKVSSIKDRSLYTTYLSNESNQSSFPIEDRDGDEFVVEGLQLTSSAESDYDTEYREPNHDSTSKTYNLHTDWVGKYISAFQSHDFETVHSIARDFVHVAQSGTTILEFLSSPCGNVEFLVDGMTAD